MNEGRNVDKMAFRCNWIKKDAGLAASAIKKSSGATTALDFGFSRRRDVLVPDLRKNSLQNDLRGARFDCHVME
jgi:hypothetical protein